MESIFSKLDRKAALETVDSIIDNCNKRIDELFKEKNNWEKQRKKMLTEDEQ